MSYTYGSLTNIQLPDSASDLVTYIRRRLGEPVKQVNVSDEQIYDRIADALQLWRDYNSEGMEQVFIAHELTNEDLENKYIEVSDNILEVIRVIQPSTIARNLFENIDYMMFNRLNFSDYATGTGMYLSSVTEFMLMREQLENISHLFKGQKNIKFNRHQGKLYYYGDMDMLFEEGQILMYEAYAIVDPAEFGRLLSNRVFLDLVTAFVKRQWGMNMKLYDGINLFGGQKINGTAIYNEAIGEIDDVKATLMNEAEMPTWIIG